MTKMFPVIDLTATGENIARRFGPALLNTAELVDHVTIFAIRSSLPPDPDWRA